MQHASHLNNDLKMHAPFDATRMMSRLKTEGAEENDTEDLQQSWWTSEEMWDLLVTTREGTNKQLHLPL